MIGRIDEDRRLIVEQSADTRDGHADGRAAGQTAAHRDVRHAEQLLPEFDGVGLSLHELALDVLRHPAVASKSFLITIGDRTVGGMCSRDSMVGPWQIPVADCAVTS